MPTIFCQKLKQELEGLDYQPYPGELGKKILQNISKQAWQAWQARQIMFINEYRLVMSDPKAQTFLRQEMENFLFGDSEQLPAGYVATSTSE